MPACRRWGESPIIKLFAATLRPMNSKPHSPLINTQLQLGAGPRDGRGNRFNGFYGTAIIRSAADRQPEPHIAVTRSSGQTVETVSRSLPALHTQLKLGVRSEEHTSELQSL